MVENDVIRQIENRLIASCQPVEHGPMDTPEIITAMAKASAAGGAGALRIQGVENIRLVANIVDIPIVGIIKRDLEDSEVRITPFLEDVRSLAEAGAKIIACDATFRERPVPVERLLQEIHKAGCIAMADISSFEEGVQAAQMGFDLIGTTLSGYTSGATPEDPDFALISDLHAQGLKVVAEGRFNSPELAGQAIKAGAYCVTVGSAITRVEYICQWFSDAINQTK
ncbi:N-acetylmannosamine-6-phosphate 2-epimerase [Endozoicomonas sp.]|uniref:N-acetylmannosamine-6-phosphate 2-epimerase n=1 Tax=Endozoicomonas sp. TaxID=1892382 RepID=UPI00383BD04D